MSLSLLLDLDDTLLTNDINQFLPVYLKKLSEYVGMADSKAFINHLLKATSQMILNNDPGKSLEEVFDEHFYPALGINRADIETKIDAFYTNIFPSLQPLTSPRPEAVELVDHALSKGYQVVVATNPVFPRKAVLHRLHWANLPPDRYLFSLITSYEQFHFAKPNPAYFVEILAQLGWPNQPIAIIGNDFNEDITPSMEMGIPCFWVNPNGDTREIPEPCSSGPLSKAKDWIDQMASASACTALDTPQALLAILKSTPAALNAICRKAPPESWNLKPCEGQWSVKEILCHLRDVDQEINFPRLKEICESENPFIPGVASNQWAVERNYQDQDGQEALRSFTAIRLKLVKLLEELIPKGWDCPARHAIFGPTRTGELVSFIATHDKAHIKQVLETLKTVNGSFEH